jgi:hypothetical protein
MASYTLAEYAKTVSDPLRRGVIETLYEDEPIIGLVPFESINGLARPYNREESLPSVAFRNINESYTPSVGVVNRLVEVLKPFGGESDTDRALIRAYGMGERTTRDRAHSKAMAVKFVQTMLYGNSPGSRAGTAFDDIKGFDGIEARVTTAQTVDALGTGASTGSSVFAIRFGDGYTTGLQTTEGVDVEDLGILQSKPAYRTRIEHIAGMAIYHGKSVAWIKDLAPATQVLTPTLMDQLADLIVGRPSAYLMTKRSRRQLKNAAKTSHGLSVGMDQLGNIVDQWDGVPIYVSDAMIDTEVMP